MARIKLVLIAVALACSGCWGQTRTAEQEAKRQVCLLAAEAKSDDRADRECTDAGFFWDECPARQSIMLELKDEQERCR